MIDAMSLLAPSLPQQRTDARDIAGAAKQFEAQLVKQMLSEMPLAGLQGTQAETFLSLFHEALAEKLVEGGGLGLAAQIEAAMTRETATPLAESEPRREVLPSSRGRTSHARISSPFGERHDPIDGTRKRHRGIDIAAQKGSNVHAARSGRVSFAGEAGGYGNLVVIEHGSGLQTRYAHCHSIDVKAGDHVSNGQVIARVGDTGRATGPHLHFEVREDGIAVDPTSRFDFSQPLVETIREGVRDDDLSHPEGTP